MHARHILALGMGCLDQFDDLLQVQLGAVDQHFGAMAFEHGCRYQGAGVDDDGASADQPMPLDGNQLGIAGACANEVDRHARVPEKPESAACLNKIQVAGAR
ncbi:hypothetical protein D9M73_207170 [compost metagenome]